MKKILSVALFASMTIAGCTTPETKEPSKISVAASFYPLAFIAQHIGGDDASVTQITPGGVEPHEYEPTPRQLTAVYAADVFLMNGGGIDAWADKIIDELSDAKATVRILDAIKPMGGFDEEGKENPFAPASDESALDPHIWLDPIAMIEESMLVRDAFVKADPDHASTYEANANLLRKELDDLDASFREGLAHCDRREVVVSHNAFRYMAKRYGFTTYAISGLSPEEDPSPKRIAELAELAKQHDIRYIFFETLVSPKLSETIASEIGAQSLVLNPIEGLTSDDLAQGKNYVSIMRKNLQNLRTAMHCQ